MNDHDDLIKELENIVEQDYEKFYDIVYRITESHQDTEDFLQNSFLKAYNNLKNFRGQSKLSTWFYRIAINESYRYIQSWKKLTVIAIVEDLNINETTFLGNLEYDENFVDEVTAVMKLTANQKMFALIAERNASVYIKMKK